ncbi:MAG TPA: HAD family phosphatase [Pyrinomonadaceae bacterium]|nr:HAD family phosphatase [Pyrinomonadaceae bacterium]
MCLYHGFFLSPAAADRRATRSPVFPAGAVFRRLGEGRGGCARAASAETAGRALVTIISRNGVYFRATRISPKKVSTTPREDGLGAAAFYDLEGTLVSTNLVHTLGFYARNQQGIWRSLKKSTTTLLSIPLFAATDQYSRKVFNDLFFKRYKGETEDRLRFFADELFESVLKPAVFPGSFDLIAKSKALGLRQVVVTGALDISVRPLMKYLGIDEYVANHLEFVNGVATGRLLPPVLAAATKASWIRAYAEREGINLNDSYAYSDSMSDLPMLSIVGHPAAVNPDARLRQTALHHDWPVLNLK